MLRVCQPFCGCLQLADMAVRHSVSWTLVLRHMMGCTGNLCTKGMSFYPQSMNEGKTLKTKNFVMVAKINFEPET